MGRFSHSLSSAAIQSISFVFNLRKEVGDYLREPATISNLLVNQIILPLASLPQGTDSL